MIAANGHEVLVTMLDGLKLTAIRDQFDTLLDEVARSEMTLRDAQAFLTERETAWRGERRIGMAGKWPSSRSSGIGIASNSKRSRSWIPCIRP